MIKRCHKNSAHLLADSGLASDTAATPPASNAGEHYPIIPPSKILDDYFSLSGSTTFFLESRAGCTVGVEVLEQYSEQRKGYGIVLLRHSRLYLHAPHNALLVAQAELLLDRLLPTQRERVLSGNEALGKLLDPDNRQLLHKVDRGISLTVAPGALCVNSRWAISRSFDLQLEGVTCARMCEIVNEESLARLG